MLDCEILEYDEAPPTKRDFEELEPSTEREWIPGPLPIPVYVGDD